MHRSSLHPRSPIPQFHAWFRHAQQSPHVKAPETCVLSTASLPSGRVSSRAVYLKELTSDGEEEDGAAADDQGGGAGGESAEKKAIDGSGDKQRETAATAAAFVIYSNFGTSRKGVDLATNPHCSLVFWWEPLQRQVRVEGRASRLDPSESQAYFDTRARGSRIGAWASRQSQVLEPVEGGGGGGGVEGDDDDGRAKLEGWVREVEQKFEGEDKIPVPDFWGGLRIVPDRVEFWQGRESRLHDRFVYVREGSEDETGEARGEIGTVDGPSGAEKKPKWTLQRLSP